jgi:putative transposase
MDLPRLRAHMSIGIMRVEQGVQVPKGQRRYPPEFRAEAIRLVRQGERSPEQVAGALGCSAQSIRNWMRQADLDAGRRRDGLTTAERKERRRLHVENRALRMEQDLLQTSAGVHREGQCSDPETVFRFIESEKGRLPIAFLCRSLGVSTSGYYAWRRRSPSRRAVADAALTELIRQIHTASHGAYGAPRVHAKLAETYGIRCSRKRVARLMRASGLRGS